MVTVMRNLLDSWKNLFINPPGAFAQITGQEKVGVPLLIVLLVSMVAMLPMLPVMGSDAYFQAQTRASIRMMLDMGLTITPETEGELQGQEVLTRAFLFAGLFLSQPLDLVVKIVASSLAVMVIGYFFRERRLLRTYLLMFCVIGLFWIIEAAARNAIILARDILPSLEKAQSIDDIAGLLVVQTSLVAFLPDSLGVFTMYTMDYFTDIFRLIILAFMVVAVRVVWNRDARTALSATLIYAMAGYLIGALSLMQIAGKETTARGVPYGK